MKKRVLALILAIMMVLTNIAPSFATSSVILGQNMDAQSEMDGANKTDDKNNDNDKNESDEGKNDGASPFRQKNDEKLNSFGKNLKGPDLDEKITASLKSASNQSSSQGGQESSDPAGSGKDGSEEGNVHEDGESESSNKADGNQENDEFPYIGYNIGAAGIAQKLYVEKKGITSDRRVVYCFNKKLHWPDTKNNTKDLAYKKTTGSVDHFRSEVYIDSKYKGQDLIEKLKAVLLNGYPNSNKIQKSLGLSDDQMRGVTQMAVWHFTDDAYKDIKSISGSYAEALAYAILVEMAGPTVNGKATLEAGVKDHFLAEYKKENDGYEIPDDLEMDMRKDSTLDLYIQNGVEKEGKGYQNLLGASLIDKNTGDIIKMPKEKSKKEISISKNGKEGLLGGANLSIAKADDPDTVIQTIKSSAEAASKIELEVDTEYILNETSAPEGYQKISGVKFKVDSEGDIIITYFGQYEDGTKPDDIGVSTFGSNLYITDIEKPKESKIFFS